jgi:hypothetical protein
MRSVQPFANPKYGVPLLACETLNNIDKHRRLTTMLVVATTHEVILPNEVVAEDFRVMGPIRDGAEFARLRFWVPRQEEYAKITPGLEVGVEGQYGLNDILTGIPACIEGLITEAPLERKSPGS